MGETMTVAVSFDFSSGTVSTGARQRLTGSHATAVSVWLGQRRGPGHFAPNQAMCGVARATWTSFTEFLDWKAMRTLEKRALKGRGEKKRAWDDGEREEARPCRRNQFKLQSLRAQVGRKKEWEKQSERAWKKHKRKPTKRENSVRMKSGEKENETREGVNKRESGGREGAKEKERETERKNERERERERWERMRENEREWERMRENEREWERMREGERRRHGGERYRLQTDRQTVCLTDKQIGKHTDMQRERRDRGRDGEREMQIECLSAWQPVDAQTEQKTWHVARSQTGQT